MFIILIMKKRYTAGCSASPMPSAGEAPFRKLKINKFKGRP